MFQAPLFVVLCQSNPRGQIQHPTRSRPWRRGVKTPCPQPPAGSGRGGKERGRGRLARAAGRRTCSSVWRPGLVWATRWPGGQVCLAPLCPGRFASGIGLTTVGQPDAPSPPRRLLRVHRPARGFPRGPSWAWRLPPGSQASGRTDPTLAAAVHAPGGVDFPTLGTFPALPKPNKSSRSAF